MDEFVSKKLLVAKFNELASKYIDGDKRQRGLAYTTAADMIALADAADVQPVKRGKWINAGDFEECSECHATRLKEFQSYYGKVTRWEKSNYCPNCGARMDGEHE